jgi:hypothetical protein
MTNPMGYYDQMAKKGQATKSVVKEGGTTKSIELTKKDLFTSVTGELEPRLDPLIGSFEIQNQGEFNANRIKLDLWASWKNPVDLTQVITTGILGKFECSQLSTSTGTGTSTGTCIWSQTTYPQEIRIVNFMFNTKSWSLPGVSECPDLKYCVDTTPGKECDCIDGCCDSPHDNATYKHSGQTVNVNVNLTYDYNVNVSIPIEVIDQVKYRNLLQARQITLQELTSQYTGGPVKATLWSQKQPVREGELSLFVASIVNEGGGTLNYTRSFTILIPVDLVDSNKSIEIIAQTFKGVVGETTPTGCGDITANPNPPRDTINGKDYYVIRCKHVEPMKSGEYKRVSFFITPKDVTDRKTSLIVGLANYEYIKIGSASITVANAPWH